MDEALQSPQTEARGLLSLLALRQESLAGIRRLIRSRADVAYAQKLEIAFDAMLLYVCIPSLREGRVRILRRRNGRLKPSAALEAAILDQLKQGKPRTEVARILGVRLDVVRHVAEKHQTAQWIRGRGRRLTESQTQELVNELKAGARPVDLQRQHGVCAELVRKLRRIYLNDYRNLRRLPNEEEIKQALRGGMAPSEVAQKFGVGRVLIWRWRRRREMGIYTDLRKRNKLLVSDAERGEILKALRNEPMRTVAGRFHHHYLVIRDIAIAAGQPPRHVQHFTASQRTRILAALGKGKMPAQISQEIFGSSKFRVTIWYVKKRWKEEGIAWKTSKAA